LAQRITAAKGFTPNSFLGKATKIVPICGCVTVSEIALFVGVLGMGGTGIPGLRVFRYALISFWIASYVKWNLGGV
jgi:hypothetical protein